MVAIKNTPKQDYQTSYATNRKYTSMHSKSRDTIDEIIKPPNELYQKRLEPLAPDNEYDLSEPTWFDEIMKKLANDNAKKTEKQQKLYHNFN